MTKPDGITYAMALEQMAGLRAKHTYDRTWRDGDYIDAEAAHSDADEILCAWLTQQGYDELVQLWERVPKWYA